jgi:hypothetical protein
MGMVLPVFLCVERRRESRGKHAIPEVVPAQQISYHAFAIQEIIAYALQKLEEQVLDIVDVFLLSLFSHRWFLLGGRFSAVRAIIT